MAKDEGKLWHILSLFQSEDWDRLRHYLNSSYFNRSLPVKALGEAYFQACTSRSGMPDDHQLYAAVFDGQPFDKVRMKNLRAALQRKVDDFLAQSAWDQDPVSQAEYALRKLEQLSDKQFFMRYLDRATDLIAASAIDESRRQLSLYACTELLEAARIRQPDRGQREMYGAGAYHHAWQFFQLLTIRHLIAKTNSDAIVGESESADGAGALGELMLASQSEIPVIRLHALLLEVYRHPENAALFERLKEEIGVQSLELAPSDLRYLFTGAVNHCIRRINLGETGYMPILVNLYKQMDARNLLLSLGKLSAPQFKNMINLGLRCQEIEWAESLISRYGELLENDPHGNAVAFSQGMLCYHKGDLVAAERYFHRVLGQYEDVFFGLDARSILLRVYYETNNAVGMESLAESFKAFVKRNKQIAKSRKDGYLTTAKFFKRFIQISPWDRPALLAFDEALQKAAFPSSSKQWLIEKVALLLSSIPKDAPQSKKY